MYIKEIAPLLGKENYAGTYPIDTIEELFGQDAIHKSSSVTVEYVDLGFFDLMMSGPKLPGVNKRRSLEATLGGVLLSGVAETRGIFKKLPDDIGVSIRQGSQQTRSLIELALKVGNGHDTARLRSTYDGTLVVPTGISHVSADELNGARLGNEKGITFGDPYLPQSKLERFPILFGESPQPGLIDNQLFIDSRAGNLAEAYYNAGRALSAATESSQPDSAMIDLMARGQGIEPWLFEQSLQFVGNSEPMRAARLILTLAAENQAQY